MINIQDLGYPVDPVCFPCSSIEPLISRCRPEPSGSLTRLISKNLPAAHTVRASRAFQDGGRENRGVGSFGKKQSDGNLSFGRCAESRVTAFADGRFIQTFLSAFRRACSCILCPSGHPHAHTRIRTHEDVRVNLGMRGGERGREKKREREERKREKWSTSPSFARGDSLSRLRIVEMNLSPENLRKSRRNEKQEELLSRRAGFCRNDADVGDKNAPTSSQVAREACQERGEEPRRCRRSLKISKIFKFYRWYK